MKPVTWDSGVTWDDPNLRWGDPSYLLEPGDEGYVAPPGTPLPEPPRKKKTFRPRAKTQTHATPNLNPSTMPTFKYNVAPNSNGGFTTRPVLGEPATSDFILAQIAAKSGATPEACTAVLNATRDTILECAQGCAYATSVLGWLRFRPTSGGSQPAPDAFDNPDEINASVALSFTADTITGWRSTLTLESQGEIGKTTPYVASIESMENGQEDHYTAGTMIGINGNNLRFNKADLTQGVFIRTGNNPEVRLAVYGPITPTSITALIPTGTAGAQTVRVAAYINGSVRSFTYQTPIT
jgi:hypothetical protein